jgi:hypothetical protein
MATCTVQTTDKDGKPLILVRDQLAFDGISYILRSLSPEARLGSINAAQNQHLAHKILQDWFVLVYINHYDKGLPIEKDPFYTSGYTLICLLLSRAEGGRDRQLAIEKIKAQNPATNMIMAGR